MRVLLAALLLATAACGPRQVEVGTAPAEQAQVSLHVTNNTNQAVNVYVNTDGTDMLVGQVAGGANQHIPVAGVGVGSTVTISARSADGTRRFQANEGRPVTLTGMYTWQIP